MLTPAPAVLSFADAARRAGPLLRRLPRVETVAIKHIVGSVGRAGELGPDFRPRRHARRTGDDQRLEKVRGALERGEVVPPIELYQLGSGYYVLDGHHRVAAARLLGQFELDAYVLEHVPTGHLLRPRANPSHSVELTQPGDACTAA